MEIWEEPNRQYSFINIDVHIHLRVLKENLSNFTCRSATGVVVGYLSGKVCPDEFLSLGLLTVKIDQSHKMVSEIVFNCLK